jgi:hypothetical protein
LRAMLALNVLEAPARDVPKDVVVAFRFDGG